MSFLQWSTVILSRWQDDKIISVPSRNYWNIFLVVLLHILSSKQKNLNGKQFDKIEKVSLCGRSSVRDHTAFPSCWEKVESKWIFFKVWTGWPLPLRIPCQKTRKYYLNCTLSSLDISLVAWGTEPCFPKSS